MVEDRIKFNFTQHYYHTGNYKIGQINSYDHKYFQRVYNYKYSDNSKFRVVLPRTDQYPHIPCPQTFDYLTIFETLYYFSIRPKNPNEQTIRMSYDLFVSRMKDLYSELPFTDNKTRICRSLKALEFVHYSTNSLFLGYTSSKQLIKQHLDFTIIEKDSFKLTRENGIFYIQFRWSKAYLKYVLGSELRTNKFRTFNSADYFITKSKLNRKIALFFKVLSYNGFFEITLENLYQRFFYKPSWQSEQLGVNIDHCTRSYNFIESYLQDNLEYFARFVPGLSIVNRQQSGFEDQKKLTSNQVFTEHDKLNTIKILKRLKIQRGQSINIFMQLLKHNMLGNQIYHYVKAHVLLIEQELNQQDNDDSTEQLFTDLANKIFNTDNINSFMALSEKFGAIKIISEHDFLNYISITENLGKALQFISNDIIKNTITYKLLALKDDPMRYRIKCIQIFKQYKQNIRLPYYFFGPDPEPYKNFLKTLNFV